MPRDSGGIFTLVDGYLAVTGNNILPSNHNPPLEDIATALTNSLPRNGAAAMTGNLAVGGNKITGLGDATADTDVPTFKQAKGSLLSGSVTNQANVVLNLSTYVTAGYRRFRIHLFSLAPEVNGSSFGADVSTNGGGSYVTSGVYQQALELWSDSGYAQYNESVLGDDYIFIASEIGSGVLSSYILNITIGAGNTFWQCKGHTYFITVGSGLSESGGQVSGAINALRFYFYDSDIASLEYAVEGFR